MEKNDSVTIPDLKWYMSQSSSAGVPPRCPFATATQCPRFFQSLALLGSAGSTKIPAIEEQRLKKFWEETPYWPITDEQMTWIAGEPENTKHFGRFCPEVTFERFGLFADNLFRYADELDINLAHKALAKEKSSGEDWRWEWANIHPLHYLECSLYSLLRDSKTDVSNKPKPIVELKPGFCGFKVDLLELGRRLWQRYKKYE